FANATQTILPLRRLCLTRTVYAATNEKTSKVSLSRFEPDKYIDYEKQASTLEVVKKRLNQPLTLSEKILYSHADDPKNQEFKR
ncbi:unnamed protein product, partial [Adineta steineri]